MFKRGDFVEIDELLAVVVGTVGDGTAPDDHIIVWFGDPRGTRVSEGGQGNLQPEVWTIPLEYCKLAPQPLVKH